MTLADQQKLAEQVRQTNKMNWLNDPLTVDYANELRVKREVLIKSAINLSVADTPNQHMIITQLNRAYSIDEQLKLLLKI